MQLGRGSAIAAVAAAFLVVLCQTSATADSGVGPVSPSSGGGACTFPAITINSQTVQSQVSCSTSSSGSQTLSYGSFSWTPPTCWWEPVMTASQFETTYDDMVRGFHGTGFAEQDPAAVKQFETYYAPQLDNDGSTGSWYDWVCNADASIAQMMATGVPGGWPWLWVKNGSTTAGNGGTVLTDEILAEIAAASLKIPSLSVAMSPAPDKQTVNLPTYFYAPTDSTAKQQSTASLAAFNMSVTVTAVPTDLQINVSGPDVVDGTPSSITCPLNSNGTIGNGSGTGAGAVATPSACSLVFRHATTSGADSVSASMVWNVDYTGSGAGWPRQVTVVSNPVQVNVGEIQTVNNG